MSDIMTTTLDVSLQRRQAETYVAPNSHGACKKTGMLADRIRQRLATLDLTPYAASLKASEGRSRDMIGNILNGRSAHPRADTLEKLAGVLETSVDWLLHGDGAAPAPAAPATPPVPNVQFSEARVPSRSELGERDLPVRGDGRRHAGQGLLPDRRRDRLCRAALCRPARQGRLRPSMSSAIPWIRRTRMASCASCTRAGPCQIGDTVVIVARFSEHGPSEAFIKRLVKRTGDRLIVEQFNPQATIEFKTDYIESCHKVLTMNDLLGI